MMSFRDVRWSIALAAVLAIGFVGESAALTGEQALESCRERVGKPRVQACVRSAAESRGGPWQKYLESCRAAARPAVQTCMQQALLKANGGKGGVLNADAAPKLDKATEAELAKSGPAAFVAPPRTVTDLASILEQQKPDPTQIAKLTAAAEAVPAKSLSKHDLADFYYTRAQARGDLGRVRDALADAELAVSNGQGDDYRDVVSRYEDFMQRRLRDLGEINKALVVINKQIAHFSEGKNGKGRLFGLYYTLGTTYLRRGDIDRAEQYLARSRALLTEAKAWGVFPLYASSFTATVEEFSGRVAEARGRFADAEASFRKGTLLYADVQRFTSQWPSVPAPGTYERAADWSRTFEGRVKIKQGRVGEGEASVRTALLGRLSKVGKYHIDTAGILGVLVYALQEQGRYTDAELLQRQVIDIYKGIGYENDSNQLVNAHIFLAQIVNLQRRYDDAKSIYDQVDVWTANWEPSRREGVSGGLARVSFLLAQGNVGNAVEIAQRSFDREIQRSGPNSFNTSTARGFLAAGLARDGKRDEAMAHFKQAIPILTTASNAGDDDAGTNAAARDNRVRFVLEAYMRLMARDPGSEAETAPSTTFALADGLRGQSVQRALQASSARAGIKDAVLAELVRKSQDLEKQAGASVASLNNLLTLAPEQRDEKVVRLAQSQIQKLQSDLAQTKSDIKTKFPAYGDLMNPPPPSAADLQKELKADEALLSFYFGRFDSFVWVVRKDEPVVFKRLPITLGDLNERVAKLRLALEPKAAMISDIPAFDLKLARALYSSILEPVEAAWKPAKSLIVVTNGGLGLLPLSLLPTADAELSGSEDALFADYRKVPWLARTHAVTLVPSVAALRTLRQLPPGKSARNEMIGFGDPFFSREQADDAATDATVASSQPVQVADASGVMRGVPLKRRNAPQLDGQASAQLGLLPRLPDTADELKSVALALQSDPTKILNLGKDASESKVKATDLSGFKIVAFATHGLIPGELDGLTQPALALSAPDVAGGTGDGLLTMEEILSLKLDADWVVLSACNTGAGAGAGAEAASGLGRAFFYAGTRALLVTNWSVHSQSARELVTDLFKRQADDPTVSRGEALRLAMMALVDGAGYADADGKTEFAYAHPLFWAPYTIIGDGGRR